MWWLQQRDGWHFLQKGSIHKLYITNSRICITSRENLCWQTWEILIPSSYIWQEINHTSMLLLVDLFRGSVCTISSLPNLPSNDYILRGKSFIYTVTSVVVYHDIWLEGLGLVFLSVDEWGGFHERSWYNPALACAGSGDERRVYGFSTELFYFFFFCFRGYIPCSQLFFSDSSKICDLTDSPWIILRLFVAFRSMQESKTFTH